MARRGEDESDLAGAEDASDVLQDGELLDGILARIGGRGARDARGRFERGERRAGEHLGNGDDVAVDLIRGGENPGGRGGERRRGRGRTGRARATTRGDGRVRRRRDASREERALAPYWRGA